MADRQIAGLRYCGGCNPRYDRVAAVERLQAHLPELELRPAAPGQDTVLLVCGCPAQCVDVSGLDGKLIWLCAQEQLNRAVQELTQAEEHPQRKNGLE